MCGFGVSCDYLQDHKVGESTDCGTFGYRCNKPLDESCYIDANLTGGYIAGATGGAMRDCGDSRMHWYAGPVITSPGFSGSVNLAPLDKVSTGWNCAISVSVGFPGVSFSLGYGGGEGFLEGGAAGTFPGVGGSAGCYYVSH